MIEKWNCYFAWHSLGYSAKSVPIEHTGADFTQFDTQVVGANRVGVKDGSDAEGQSVGRFEGKRVGIKEGSVDGTHTGGKDGSLDVEGGLVGFIEGHTVDVSEIPIVVLILCDVDGTVVEVSLTGAVESTEEVLVIGCDDGKMEVGEFDCKLLGVTDEWYVVLAGTEECVVGELGWFVDVCSLVNVVESGTEVLVTASEVMGDFDGMYTVVDSISDEVLSITLEVIIGIFEGLWEVVEFEGGRDGFIEGWLVVVSGVFDEIEVVMIVENGIISPPPASEKIGGVVGALEGSTCG